MITKVEIEEVQASWGRALVEVGRASSGDEAHARATRLVETHYLLDGDELLFCPTKAASQPFRRCLEAAVSYFVGGDTSFPEDRGFAFEPWASVRFENAGVICRETVGMAMGHYFFCRADGSELKVEYSFVYVRAVTGRLVIQLHHSALPYGH